MKSQSIFAGNLLSGRKKRGKRRGIRRKRKETRKQGQRKYCKNTTDGKEKRMKDGKKI